MMSTPSVRVRWLARRLASRLGEYPRAAALSSTAARLAGETLGESRITRDTRARLTPACRATSSMVSLREEVFTEANYAICAIAPDRPQAPNGRRASMSWPSQPCRTQPWWGSSLMSHSRTGPGPAMTLR